MSTEIELKFRIPGYAFKLLEIVRKQNRMVQFELDRENREIKIITDLIDFPVYSDDWNKEEIEKYIERVE